ncbi:hypothetical protein [Flagellimonas flava]|uniref:Uncharacterized protein n=1 Tax=Flagellimonas flava TaxID=570519 RepID=A0A1M5HS87_9FLAO|nr:hypothetical protein [Allomuricauda flava]SHG18831.1 hypothetical protein SAMN04488116_0165 [Allomuricauda flava]
MDKILSYIGFLRKSTNEHGVHSPFVFKYVTQCLNVRKRWHHDKSINVLLKTISYFQSQSIAVLDDIEAAKVVMDTFPQLQLNPNLFDLVYTKDLDVFQFEQLLSKGKVHNDSVILVDGIYQTPAQKRRWNQLIQLSDITVSIDMYNLGALCIRKEQEKEHFTIRI